jgi:hypothetical protein
MTAVSIPHPPPRLARAANGLPLTAAGGRRRANAHGGGRRRGHSRDMAEGDGTATVCVALLTRAFWTNMQETLAIAASSPVMRPTSIESRNTDLTGIVLNSDALWGHSCFKIHLPRAGSRLYVPAHAAGHGSVLSQSSRQCGVCPDNYISAGVRYTDSTPCGRGLGCRTQSYYRKTHRRHSHRRPSVSSLATPLHLSHPKPPPRSGSTPCHDM